MAYGYRVGEVPLPIPEAIKKGVKISRSTGWNEAIRTPVQISLGCHVEGVAQPHPDLQCPRTAKAGVRKRFARQPPVPIKRPNVGDKLNLFDFSNYVFRKVRELFQPLPADSDTGVDPWLDKCPYPLWRKEELRAAWRRCFGVLTDRHKRVKSFIKDETYPEYKHARAINSRSDEFKCRVGPIFRLIEGEVYKLNNFIKKVPVADRPRYISELLDRVGALVVESDYTAYETHFTREIFESCEFILYDWMTSNLPDHDDFMDLLNEVIAGRNHCVFKRFFVDIDATRMSGEMNTSLGNGFTNFMLISYVAECVGFKDLRCVVEGDDCLATGFGTPPSSSDFAKLGFTIKLKVHEKIAESSFCGMIFDPVDMINVSDPVDALASFGWAMSSYVRSTSRRRLDLLRCKALSYAHQYPGCPIISSLAQYGLRVTAGRDVRPFIERERSLSLWDREQYREAAACAAGSHRVPRRIPGQATRRLVERQYGIAEQTQRDVEAYLDSLRTLQPLRIPQLTFPEVWRSYSDAYVHPEAYVEDLTGPVWSWQKCIDTGPLET